MLPTEGTVPGKVGKGRRYRSPARIKFLMRVVERDLAKSRESNPKVLDELAEALGYDDRRRPRISALLCKSGRKPPKGSWTRRLGRKTAMQVTATDLGLRPIISFDRDGGVSLQDALRKVEDKLRKMPAGTRVESVLSSLPKRERARLSWAVIILQRLDELRIEPEKVRAVHVSEKDGGGYVIAGVKLSGRTFRGSSANNE